MTVTNEDFKHQSARAAEAAASFEALFQEHWPRIYAVVFRLVSDRAEAEDLALEAFLRLYRRPPRSGDNPGGWLYRVATNLSLNALRARHRRRQYEEQAGQLALEHNEPPDPAAEIERAEQRRLVRSVLAQMKPKNARLLILRHSGLGYAELAGVLRVSPASIGTLLARAEQEFELCYLARYGEMEGE